MKNFQKKEKNVPVAPKRLELGNWSLELTQVARLTFPTRKKGKAFV